MPDGSFLPDTCPSGLFGRAAFARAVEAAGARPRWWDDPARRERRYLDWVEAEAIGLSAQVAGLTGPAVRPELAAALRLAVRALAEDAAWAAARQALAPEALPPEALPPEALPMTPGPNAPGNPGRRHAA